MAYRMAIVAALSISFAAAAEEDGKGILVISPVAGGIASPNGGGGSYGLAVGYHREEGRFRYGVTALGTAGTWSLAGASLDGRWTLLDAHGFAPYLGAGFGAFDSRRDNLDLGIRPAATAEAGVGFNRFFAGLRAIVPLSARVEGARPHDEGSFSEVAVFGVAGFRL